MNGKDNALGLDRRSFLMRSSAARQTVSALNTSHVGTQQMALDNEYVTIREMERSVPSSVGMFDMSVSVTSRNVSKAWHLQYEGPGDASGLIYLLGTNFLRSPFSPPRLHIDVSSIDENSSADPSILCSRDSYEETGEVDLFKPFSALRTRWDRPLPAWFSIELGKGRFMKILRYSIRSGSDRFGSDTMIDWELQGRIAPVAGLRKPTGNAAAYDAVSKDQCQWVVLSKHVGDRRLLDASQRRQNGDLYDGWATFLIWDKTARSLEVDAIRIVMTSPNSSGNTRLTLSNLELYGVFTDVANPSK